MTRAASRFSRPENKQTRLDRFALTLLDERERQEELDALRVALLSTSLRDRSAAQHVADVFRVDLSTVYRWTNGDLACRPLRDFLDLLDACIEAKGSENPAALELARLIRRRYLESEPAEDLTSAALTGGVASLLRTASLFAQRALAAVDPESKGGEAIDPETELPDMELLLDELDRMVRTLRPRLQARAGRRIAVHGGST